MNFLLFITILHAIILCHVDVALGQVSSKSSYACPTICNCPDETSLHCQHADLSRIPSTSTETTTLDLRFNKIEIIPEGELNHLRKLNTLILSYNKISTIEEGAFKDLILLEKLYINHNRLNYIFPNTFRYLHNLKNLRVDENPLVCDCQMLRIARRAAVKLSKSNKPTCYKPNNLHGKAITELEEADFDYCPLQSYMNEELWGPSHAFHCQRLAAGRRIENFRRGIPAMKQHFISHGGRTRVLSEDDKRYQCLQYGRYYPWASNHDDRYMELRFIDRPRNVRIREGERTIFLPCRARGNPSPVIVWYKNNQQVIDTRHIKIEENGLRIINAGITDGGRYICTARNHNDLISTEVIVDITRARPPVDYIDDDLIFESVKQAFKYVNEAIAATKLTLFSKTVKRTPAVMLMRLRYPSPEASKLVSRHAIFETSLSILGNHLDISTSSFSYLSKILSPRHIAMIANLTGCNQQMNKRPDCSNLCYHMKYRSYDGSCNNLQYTSRGAALSQLVRLLRPAYEDELNEPIGWNSRKLTRPSARVISQNIISTLHIIDDDIYSHMLMQWGQFIDHDISLIVGSTSRATFRNRIPCDKLCRNDPPCFPIIPAPGDKRVPDDGCIELTRSSAACGTGASSIFFHELLPRQQLNQVTSYIDGSTVYGSSREEAKRLRDLDNDYGLLKEGIKATRHKSFLPFHNGAPVDCQTGDQGDETVPCFLAGDIRVNEHVALTAMHTIWMREHNRIAKILKKLNYHWKGEKIFQEARKIVIAEIQHITFHDFLPKILGYEGLKLLGHYQGYKPDIDATLINAFATAAFRFGHGTVRPIIHRLNHLLEAVPQGHLRLRDAFFSPSKLLHQGGIDPLLRGLIFFSSKLSRSDAMLNEELTDHLFETAHDIALDLASLNIQRGRDHGLPSYNHYRVMCNLPAATYFHELSNEIANVTVLEKLHELYQHPNNIDLWVGAMSEDALLGSRVGPTFACLIALQFNRIRAGDRFWYENKGQFLPEQLTQIKRTSLARIICDNSDNITRVQNDVFLNVHYEGEIMNCDDIPSVDLKYWYECQAEKSPRNKVHARSKYVEKSPRNKVHARSKYRGQARPPYRNRKRFGRSIQENSILNGTFNQFNDLL